VNIDTCDYKNGEQNTDNYGEYSKYNDVKPVPELGGAGLFDLDPKSWTNQEGQSVSSIDASDFYWSFYCTKENYLGDRCELIKKVYYDGISKIPVDPKLMELLNIQCKWMGDCSGEPNYLLRAGGSSLRSSDYDYGMADCRKSGEHRVTCTFKYECLAWNAANNADDCSKCGSDNLPCSEYRCKSLGKKCSYYRTGSGEGYCKSSDDKTPVAITLVKYPIAAVEPYSSVEFAIKTSEMAECKFSFNDSSYSEMKNYFGAGYSVEHNLILYPPANSPKLDASTRGYGLIKEGGNYTLYVRCEDAAGNSNPESFKINFNVMQTPDKQEPKIISFKPASGSKIKNNATTKTIKFKLNEPSQCKWDFADKRFDLMKNSFSCDEIPSIVGMNLGYYCRGTLNNITTNINEETKFYLKCKDQPWLQGKEDNFYRRNVNEQSTSYILRPSEALEIIEVSPVGNIILGLNEQLYIKTITAKGALSGKANCSYAIGNSENFIKFSEVTNNIHKSLFNFSEGDYFIQVACFDIAGNTAAKNFSFNVKLDSYAPVIRRIFESAGNLKIKTNENSECFYSFDKNSCSSSLANFSAMAGNEKEHTTEWKDDKKYYIKCRDYFGNVNLGCSIIRTY
jgi:hypothetical protein